MATNVNGLYPGEIYPDAVVGGCINIYENVWPNPQRTIEMVERECANPNSGAFWQRAETIGKGPFQEARTNKLLSVSHLADVSNNGVLQNVHNQFYMSLLATTIPYATKYSINETMWHEGYNLLKYETLQEYKAHYDGDTGLGRVISAIVYLNNDYEGGELEFPNFGIKIKPEPGMMILFPSNFAYTHIAHPVTKGTKYALVTWIRDRQI
jgi:predicted 2-oxoglutarate/Fe(II)-dependent dioxygenase YbiX